MKRLQFYASGSFQIKNFFMKKSLMKDPFWMITITWIFAITVTVIFLISLG